MNYNDLIGSKYKIHGRNVKEGFDCYGLAIEVLRRNNIYLKDYIYESLSDKDRVYNDALTTLNIKKLDKIENLCIIEMESRQEPCHIAVCIGEGQLIHTSKYGVVIEPIWKYQKRIKGVYKVINS